MVQNQNTRLRLAGMSAELHGAAGTTGRRSVLLHGLTFDRDIWRTTLAPTSTRSTPADTS